MNASNSVSYDCLDYTGERGAGGISVRYATLRRAHAGEPDILPSTPVIDGPDDHFKWAADVMTRALNPFGIRYGSVTFTTGSTADVRAAWADIPSGMGRAAPGAYAVWKDYRSYPSNQVPTALHELVHAWLGAPDYYNNTGCWEGRGLSGLLFQGGGVSDPLSPRGQDGVRYWALKTDSWR